MKKLNLVLAVLVVLCLLSGCHGSEGVEMTTGNSQSNGYMAAPRVVKIRSEEALQELLNMTTMSDAAFNEFMIQKAGSADYSGIESKDEVSALSQLIQEVGLPVVKNKNLVESYILSYRPEQQMYDVKYIINGVMYGFQYTPFEEFIDRSEMEPIAEYTLGGTEFPVYQGVNAVGGEIYANGYQILIYIKNFTNVNVLDIAQFTWSTDMHYIK